MSVFDRRHDPFEGCEAVVTEPVVNPRVAAVPVESRSDGLEANPDDVVLDQATGRFSLAGTPAVGRTWAELDDAATTSGDPLAVITAFQAPAPTLPFGAPVAVVDVDMPASPERVRWAIQAAPAR